MGSAESLPLVRPVLIVMYFVLQYGAAALGIWAVSDASSRRPDAFAAADKQSKAVWAGITAACAVVFVLGAVVGAPPFDALGLLWLAAMVGTLVYFLDVRPRLREAQRGSRW